MMLQMFAVYDSKARVFIPPFFSSTIEVAQRAFSAAANDPAHALCRNPEDFTLYQLGQFNDDTALVELLPQKINHGTALSYRRSVVFSDEVKNVQQ